MAPAARWPWRLADAGASAVTIFDVDSAKAEALADADRGGLSRAARCAPRPVHLPGHDTLINATPIGMAPGDGLPAPVDGLTSDMLVIDVIIKPARHAAARPCPRAGLPECSTAGVMLDGQAHELVQFFTGTRS